MGLVREELQPLLLRIAATAGERGEGDAAAAGRTLIDIEALVAELEALAPELLYGIPPWLSEELDRVITLVREPPDLHWAEVAGLLFQSRPSGTDDALYALDRAARLTAVASKSASYALRNAVRRGTPVTTSEEVDAEARWRGSLLDVPLLIPGEHGRAVLASLDIRFEQGDPDHPAVRPAGQVPPSPEFETGLAEGLWAAQDLLLRLGVPEAVRLRHAHLTYRVVGLPIDLPPLVGRSAGLPAALHTLGSALDLGPMDAVSSGSVTNDGTVEQLDTKSAEAKSEAVAADGLRDRFVCNWPGAGDRVETVAAAAVVVWGEAWSEAVTKLLDRKLEPLGLRAHWRLPWADLPKLRQLDGADLLGDTGDESELRDGLRTALGSSRLVLGPPGSGRTTLVARVAAELGGSPDGKPWQVVRLVPRDGLIPTKPEAICRDVRLAFPRPTPLLVVIDALDAAREEPGDISEFETNDPQIALLVVSNESHRRRHPEDAESPADLILAELGTATAMNIATGVVEAHESLQSVTPDRLKAVVRRSHDNLAVVIDKLAQIGGDAEPGAAAERFAAATTDAPLGSILTLASRSAIGLTTPPGRLGELTLQQVRSLGVSPNEDGWLIQSPGLAEELVSACALRQAQEGGSRRRYPSILRDQLAEEVRHAVREYADSEVIALLGALAHHRPAFLRPIMAALRPDLEDWARRADVRALRSFLLVGHSRMEAEQSEALLDLFAEKLMGAIEEEELTGLDVARGLRLVLLEHPRLLEEASQGSSRRARMLDAVSSQLDSMLTDAGSRARQRLLIELQRLDVEGSAFTLHAAVALKDLHPDRRRDYQLALSVLKAIRGQRGDAEPVKLIVARARELAEAARRRLPKRADLVILELALAVELERYGVGLHAPRPTEGPGERDYRVRTDVSAKVGELYDRTNPFGLIGALVELAQVNKGICSQVIHELERTEEIHQRLAGSLKNLAPLRAADTLKMMDRVGGSLAFAVLFRKASTGSKPRRSLLRSLKANIARTLDAKGASDLLQVARRIDESWGRRPDGFAHVLCEELGVDLLIELVDIHRHDRVTADLIGAVVASLPSVDLMRPFTEKAYEPLVDALLHNPEVSWPARAAMSLGYDVNPEGEAFLDRMRGDERLVKVLSERMNSARDAPTFTRTNQLGLALLPDRSQHFRSSRQWLPAVTEARSLTDAVEAFGAASFTLSQDSEGNGSHEAATKLKEAGWSWRKALALGTTSQRVTEALTQLHSLNGASAKEAVAPPERDDEEDRLLGWVSRNDGRSPQVHSDLLQSVAQVDAVRAGELLERFRERDPGHWERLLRLGESDQNPRTQARIYNSLAQAGYTPPEDVRSRLLASWTAPTGTISHLRRTPPIFEVLVVCGNWGAAPAAIRAIDAAAVAETLRPGRDEDLPYAQSLIGQMYVGANQFPELRTTTTRVGTTCARALSDIDELAWRVGMRYYSRLIGVIAKTDPDLGAKLQSPAQKHLNLQIARRHRWRPVRHWLNIGWLSWQLSAIGFPAHTTVADPPANLAGVGPAQRLFSLGWLDGPPWVGAYVEQAFEAMEGQTIRGTNSLALVLATAVHHGRAGRLLASNQRWERLFESNAGSLTALIPGLREGNPDLIDFFRNQEGLDALIESLRSKARRLDFAAGLFLETLEEVDLAEPVGAAGGEI
jgi:hypothetical protein